MSLMPAADLNVSDRRRELKTRINILQSQLDSVRATNTFVKEERKNYSNINRVNFSSYFNTAEVQKAVQMRLQKVKAN